MNLETHKDLRPENKEIHRAKKQKQEYKHIGSIKIIKGLTLYACNMETQEINKVVIEKKASIGLDGKEVRQQKAQHDPKCVYIQAINIKNARRKLEKFLEKHKK